MIPLLAYSALAYPITNKLIRRQRLFFPTLLS